MAETPAQDAAAALTLECVALRRRAEWAEAVADSFARRYERERRLRIQAGQLAAAALAGRLTVTREV